MNREEAGLLCQAQFDSSIAAAQALITRGAARVLVTDGGGTASEATGTDVISATPQQVLVTRVTGAGDTFMAAHIAAELNGADRAEALANALDAAATYVSGQGPE